MEKEWSYVESLIRQMLANESWGVVTAADAQEQSNRRTDFVEKIKNEFDKIAEDAWKYRDLKE